MKKTILVVDDFENTRFVIEFTLKNAGFEVLKASDGKEATKFLDGRKLDLVITDYNMPNMNGLELTQYIRNVEQYQFIPVLMLTTETDQKKKEMAKDAAVTGWIQKPFKMEKFLAVVEKCLR